MTSLVRRIPLGPDDKTCGTGKTTIMGKVSCFVNWLELAVVSNAIDFYE
jgi:hypothetical protein